MFLKSIRFFKKNRLMYDFKIFLIIFNWEKNLSGIIDSDILLAIKEND